MRGAPIGQEPRTNYDPGAMRDFWFSWFCGRLGPKVLDLGVGREFGNPARRYVGPKEARSFIPSFVMENRAGGRPSFMSINYFAGSDRLVYIERVFTDIDVDDPDKSREMARTVTDRLSPYCTPLVVYTGGRGYQHHCWISSLIKVSNPTYLKDSIVEFLRRVGVLDLNIDKAVLEPKRLSRIPYTWHQKTYRLSVVVDERDLRPVDPESVNLDRYFASSIDIEIIREIYEGLKFRYVMNKIKRDHVRYTGAQTIGSGTGGLRPRIEDLREHNSTPPCIKQLISKFIDSGRAAGEGGNEHSARLIILWYLIWLGYNKEEIVEFYRRAEDFNESATRRQVDYAYRKLEEGNPYCIPSCSNMKGMGFCAGCRWGRDHRNPLTYSIVRGLVPGKLRTLFFNVVSGTKYGQLY